MAKRAFTHCADDYARHRPGYPAEALEVLASKFGPPPGKMAADVGAGTGIFSTLLAGAGWSVVSLDADAVLLRHAPSADPLIRRVCATAERTPLVEAGLHLVTCAQAFHWFNPPVALAEFARILRPGGGLALLWNNRDAAQSEFVRRYERLIKTYNPAYDREYRRQDWPAKIAAEGRFTATEHARYARTWELSPGEFVGFSRSVSYIRNVLSGERMSCFERDLRELLRAEFGSGPCRLPLITELWTCSRREV